MVGLTLDGNTFTFAQNDIVLTANQIGMAGKTVAPGNYRGQEFAGACYSPDGKWLFANIQTPGNHLRHHRPMGERTALSTESTAESQEVGRFLRFCN